MRLPLTRYGFRELLVFSVVFGALTAAAFLLLPPLAIIPAALLCFTVAFFRDPKRIIPDGPGLMVSPADGVVTDITDVNDAEFIGGPARRVGIFLSVFNVHINRAPCEGKVAYLKYRPGKFVNAMRLESSRVNEANSVGMILPDEKGTRVLVRQISGAIARRIVCEAADGDTLERGEKFGMIKFGSRTELYVPRDLPFDIEVGIGTKVKAGATVIGRIREE